MTHIEANLFFALLGAALGMFAISGLRAALRVPRGVSLAEAIAARCPGRCGEPRPTVLPSAPRAPRPPGFGWILTVLFFAAVVIGVARLIATGWRP